MFTGRRLDELLNFESFEFQSPRDSVSGWFLDDDKHINVGDIWITQLL